MVNYLFVKFYTFSLCTETFITVSTGKCDVHGDIWANEIRLLIEGVVSGLHAAEASYHKDCTPKLESFTMICLQAN